MCILSEIGRRIRSTKRPIQSVYTSMVTSWKGHPCSFQWMTAGL